MNKSLFPLGALAILVGCSPTATLSSNLRPGYKPNIQSIYIVSMVDTNGSPEFLSDVLHLLSSKLSLMSIKTRTHVRNPLSLNEKKEMETEMATFRPTTIMHVTQTARISSSGSGGSFGGATFEISIFEPNEDTPYWKGVLETQTPNASWGYMGPGFGGYGSNKKVGDAQLTANRIYEKLQSDGLIAPTKQAP